MVNIVLVKNSLDPFRSQSTCQMISGLPLDHYVEAMLPGVRDGYELAVSVDGHLIERGSDYRLTDGQSLALMVVPQGSGGGGGKMVMRIVGAVVIAIAAAYTGGAAAGAYSGYGAVAGASAGITTAAAGSAAAMAVGYAAAAGVAIVGSLIMSAVLPVTSGREGNGQSSSTYGWNVGNNAVEEGAALPILFGTHRIVPPRLAAFPEMSGQDQTLNLLFAVAGHAVDSITAIQINDTDAAQYTQSWNETRLGLNDNQIMQGFEDTSVTISTAVRLPHKLAEAWKTITTNGTAVNQMGIGLVFYGGLYDTYQSDMIQATVRIKMEYSISGADDWTKLQMSSDQPVTILVDRWSGGYWKAQQNEGGDLPPAWVEIEIGSTTPADHYEGEKYEPAPGVWTDFDAQANDYIKPVFMWHWVENADLVIPAGETSTLLDYIEISANCSQPLRFLKYTPYLAAEQYDVRVALYDAESVGNPPIDSKDVYWEFYTEIITDDFIYPNVALLAVRSVATGQLANEIPRISCLATRANIYAYNPNTPGWESKLATNPAWACYDLLVGGRYIKNISTGLMEYVSEGPVAYDRIVYDDFSDWATFCALEAPYGYPDKKPYTCNMYLDTTMTLRKALDLVGLCGRGSVVQQGAMWSCVVEMPESTPVQRFCFNMSNIERDSFQEQWLAMDERANAIEVQYYDANEDYKATSLEIKADDYDETLEEIKKTSVDYRGCTDREMAIAYGKFLLNCNRYLTYTASWTADIDSIACYPGQIIELQHDVPQYGYGGRLRAGSSTTWVTLETPVTIDDGVEQAFVVYHQEDDVREDDVVIIPVVFHEDGHWLGVFDPMATYALYDVTTHTGVYKYLSDNDPVDVWTACDTSGLSYGLLLSEALTTRAPAQYAKWMFGTTGSVNKLMRVLRITRSSEQRRKLSCIEFVNAVYQDGVTVNPTNPSALAKQMFPPPLDSITAEMVWRLDNVKKEWMAYLRVSFIFDPDVDYNNVAIPISKLRVYAHIAAGDTHTAPMDATDYEYAWDWGFGVHDYPLASVVDHTFYITAEVVNMQGMRSTKCPVSATYVTTKYPVTATSQIEVDATQGTLGFDYRSIGYDVYIKWTPAGWELSGGKYTPTLTWNSGNNYHNMQKYLLAWGAVDAEFEIPDLGKLNYYETANIGDIYGPDGVQYTDADTLHSIALGAASMRLSMFYRAKWIAISMVPILKSGATCMLDAEAADLGLDWEYLHVTCPGGTGSTIEDADITNAELVYTQQPGMVVLNELNWDYSLTFPAIDGFAIISRIQSFWWSWQLSGTIAIDTVDLATIAAAIDFATSGGGSQAAADFADRYAEWYAGGSPAFYMMISSATNYEVISINTQSFVCTRGVEGTTARAWAIGDWVSYCPCEQLDTVSMLTDSAQRAYTFSPPVQVNFALHSTICAYKLIEETPGYKRSHYAFWDTVRLR